VLNVLRPILTWQIRYHLVITIPSWPSLRVLNLRPLHLLLHIYCLDRHILNPHLLIRSLYLRTLLLCLHLVEIKTKLSCLKILTSTSVNVLLLN
jgi:hypothetical protein